MAKKPVGREGWPPHQLTAAIWATPREHPFGAIATERAFVGADPGVGRVGRQIPVAAFAVGRQFKHRGPLSAITSRTSCAIRLPPVSTLRYEGGHLNGQER